MLTLWCLEQKPKAFVTLCLWAYLNILVQGNSYKGCGRCRLSCLLHYIYYLSIPLHTNSWDDISRTLFVNYPVAYSIYGRLSPNSGSTSENRIMFDWIIFLCSSHNLERFGTSLELEGLLQMLGLYFMIGLVEVWKNVGYKTIFKQIKRT